VPVPSPNTYIPGSEGSVEIGEEFTARFKDRENEPFYKCETIENGPESEPEHNNSRIP
jgi:hypothetical protein